MERDINFYKDLINDMLDVFDEVFSIEWSEQWLREHGLTKKEIIDFGYCD